MSIKKIIINLILTNNIFTINVGGKICIMSLHRQNKERLISEISNFEVGEQKIRSCPNDPISY